MCRYTKGAFSQTVKNTCFFWRADTLYCAIGRFLIDCSNVGPDRVPLNGGTAKEKGIARYQKVVLPTLMQVILKWNAYRLEHKLGWWDMIMFKEDVTNCFNQIAFSTSSSKLLCAMVDYETVVVMIT